MIHSRKPRLDGYPALLLLFTLCACLRQSQVPTPADRTSGGTLAPPAIATLAPTSGDLARATSSPGCKKIAFSMANTLPHEDPAIYTVCPDGSGLSRLTHNPGADDAPAWSPDGDQIAFQSNRSGSAQVYTMSADGRRLVQRTSDAENSWPVWLPDGNSIAFRTTDGQGLWWWRTLDLETGSIQSLTAPSFDFFFQTPAWSPDGKKLAVMSLAEQAQRNDGSSQIHVQNVDSSGNVALTNDIWANINPVWSSDGTRLAFLSERDGVYNTFALYVMAFDGSNVRRLTPPLFGESDASYDWSPDDREIAVCNRMTGSLSIIDLVTGREKQPLALKDGDRIISLSWQP